MYIDITNHCPMKCDHCCRNFGRDMPTQGQHMDRHTFELAVEVAERIDGSIQLGGGEPLSHPEFWTFFRLAMNANVENVWLATSGHNAVRTRTLMQFLSEEPDPLYEFEDQYDDDECYPYPIGGEIDWLESIRLAYFGKSKFSMALSQDVFHDPIDESVIRMAQWTDVEIRDVTHKVNMVGRAVETVTYQNESEQCEDLQCDWKGNLTLCRTHPDGAVIGNVSDYPETISAIYSRSHEIGGCKHHWTKKQWDYVLNGQ